MSESPQDVETAKNYGEAVEDSRQSTHSPASGSDPGVTLAGADAEGLAALGMDPDTTAIPVVDYGEQPLDYRS